MILVVPIVLWDFWSQQSKVEVINSEIFISDRSGKLRQLTNDGEHKQNPALSPDGCKVVYHGKYEAYTLPPTIFKVLDAQSAALLHSIPLQSHARFINKVEWIDNRYVIAEGDGQLTILDTERGGQTHYLSADWVGGQWFFLSPDRRKIIYVMGTGRGIPPELVSQSVGLALVNKGHPPTKEYIPMNSTAIDVYPPKSDPGKGIPPKDLRQRHLVKSSFSWSSDSQKVAFVEEHRRAFWLVVLDLEVRDMEVKVTPRRFKLAEELAEVTGLEWTGEEQAIQVITQQGSFLVELRRGTVQPIR